MTLRRQSSAREWTRVARKYNIGSSWKGRVIGSKNNVVGGWQDDDLVMNDESKIYSSYAQKDLVEVLASLTDEQKEIFRSIGLGGLLEMHKICRNDKTEYSWLLQRFDPSDCTIKIGKHCKVTFRETEICRLLSIRLGGDRRVQRQSGKPTASQIKKARDMLGMMPDKKKITTAELLEALKEPVESPMTAAEVNKTKVALVMMACTLFMSPTEDRHSAQRDAYAITDEPDLLNKVDFGRYILDGYIDGANKMQSMIKGGAENFWIYGCCIAMQMRYFESVDTGFLKLVPGTVPLVRVLTANLLKTLIEADTWYDNGKKTYGALQALRECHGTGKQPICEINRLLEGMSTVQREIKENALQSEHHCYSYISSITGISEEEASKLKMGLVDHLVEENSKQNNQSKALQSFIELLIKGRVTESNLEATVLEGFPMSNGCPTMHDSNVVPLPINQAGCSTSVAGGIYKDMEGTSNKCVTRSKDSMLRPVLGVCRALERKKRIKKTRKISDIARKSDFQQSGEIPDLNEPLEDIIMEVDDSVETNNIAAPIELEVAGGLLALRAGAINPISIGDNHVNAAAYQEGAQGVKEYSYGNLLTCSLEVKQRTWMVHGVPTLLRLTGLDFYEMFVKGLVSAGCFDLFARLVSQEDSKMHDILDRTRLRHVMNIGWATSVLVGNMVHENPYVRQLFMGNHMSYDIFKTRFLLVPYVNTNMCYCLYVLDMLTHNLTVYDPHMPPQSKDNIAAKHSKKCQRIIDAFAACAASFYKGWHIDTKNWSFFFHPTFNRVLTKSEGAFYILNAILNCTGGGVLKIFDEPGLVVFKMKILQWFGRMEGNLAKFPSMIIPH